jgi:Family of unknown function (DUF6527)
MASMTKIPWWQWVPGQSWRIVMVVDEADEMPARLPRNAVVLVGSHEKPKWLAFDCPCRTGHRVLLNLDPARFPYWRLKSKKKLTLAPSIDWNDNDRSCHFLMRTGHVVWAQQKGGIEL